MPGKTAFNDLLVTALDTCLNLARQALCGAHTLVGIYTKPGTKIKTILIYSTEWGGEANQPTPYYLCMDKKMQLLKNQYVQAV